MKMRLQKSEHLTEMNSKILVRKTQNCISYLHYYLNFLMTYFVKIAEQ